MKEHPAIKMPLDSLGHLCERLPARFCDPHAHNAGLSTVGSSASCQGVRGTGYSIGRAVTWPIYSTSGGASSLRISDSK
jgi:hypothetical protein